MKNAAYALKQTFKYLADAEGVNFLTAWNEARNEDIETHITVHEAKRLRIGDVLVTRLIRDIYKSVYPGEVVVEMLETWLKVEETDAN